MPLLIAALAFLLPLVALLLWRALRPGQQPSIWLLIGAFLAVVLALGGAISYGLNRSIGPDERYVPPAWERGGEDVTPGRGNRP